LRLFKCDHCGNPVYFENERCETCGRGLGFDPFALTMRSYDDSVVVEGYRMCANAEYKVCNWLVPADDAHEYCLACRHNRIVPDLSREENLARWRRFETAKHRVFYSVLRLGLNTVTRLDDPDHGLAFDMLAESPEMGAPRVLTGHDDGVITLNLKEADDVEREKSRSEMGETYRTVLGHFRHEIGHYFWDRLVKDTPQIEPFRDVFGDERADYQQALQAHYSMGAPADWQTQYISSYASCHPWEDFAESWAHYFHIVDTLEAAATFGLRVRAGSAAVPTMSAELDIDAYDAEIDQIIGAWLPLTFAMNTINRAMGEPDLYPFILSGAAIEKIKFIHALIYAHRSSHAVRAKDRSAA